MTKAEQRQLDQLLSKFNSLADKRVARTAEWFKRSFSPRHELEISFGMGSQCVDINGEYVDISYEDTAFWKGRRVPSLRPLYDLIKDLDEITDCYRRGCPDNIKVRGERK